LNEVFVIEPLPPGLILQPLSWLAAEHQRCRRVCALIEEVAVSSDILRQEMAQTQAYLRIDLPLHTDDEDKDLFPLLHRRCAPEDEVGRVLRALAAEHRRDLAAMIEISDLLDEAVRLDRPVADSPTDQRLLRDFAVRQGNHIALENAVVLPIARLRLSQDDLDGLSQGMARRREMSV
jgi:hemerythrin-like domain-containing protein